MIIGIQDEILKLNQDGLLDILLKDMTTKSNIIWGTDAYSSLGEGYYKEDEIRADLITGDNSNIIRNRVRKDLEQQSERTKAHAEVFTPFWTCKLMIDYIDKAWLGDRNACLPEEEIDLDSESIWDVVGDDNWQDYVVSRRMELTCGEAPYLVTRYDVSTGDTIPMSERTGVLDRKLAVVGKFINDRSCWMKWALRALTSTYGYEFQGDNLLIARLNLLMTFSEYYEEKFKRKLLHKDLEKATEIISWNVWQMDGLTDKVPYSYNGKTQIDFFDLLGDATSQNGGQEDIERIFYCVIRDWGKYSKSEPIETNFSELKRRDEKMFDYIIGNPPYQEEVENNGRKSPIYNLFMDETYKIAKTVELIHPARFLFNAGQTPKEWNKKMLNDRHFKVLYYEPNGAKIFPNTDIKGGVAISYHDLIQSFEAVGAFTAYKELNGILSKVEEKHEGLKENLSDIVSNRGQYRLERSFFKDFPYASDRLGAGTGNMMVSNIFEKIPEAFLIEKPDDGFEYVKVLGRVSNERVYRYCRRCYVIDNDFLTSYNVFVPKSNGSGAIGEVLSTPLIGAPLIGATDSFLSIGKFGNEEVATACLKYVKSKFARTMLGILKVTQDNPRETWRYVPMQDFTSSSDIDWSKSISEIDGQLYSKYELSDEEILFIEDKVTEMG
ncbi:MAG: Eco57I restriction-modification methylase domain-containing protein [Clostridia bacterium]|nr:Eco57I restriction-modification methylase domain-containing protein [Clostridia bacterium]